jgi:hypothetical protein
MAFKRPDMGDCFGMRLNGWSLNSCEGLEDGQQVPTPHLSPWRRGLRRDEHGRGGSVSAGVRVAKDIIASQPSRPMGLMRLLHSPLATKSLITVSGRLPRSDVSTERVRVPAPRQLMVRRRGCRREGCRPRALMMGKNFFPSSTLGQGCRSPGERYQRRRMSNGTRATRVRVACPHHQGGWHIPLTDPSLVRPRPQGGSVIGPRSIPAHGDGDVEPYLGARDRPRHNILGHRHAW